MSASPGACPRAAFQAAAMRGWFSSVLIWSRLAMPIGPRASSTVISTPNCWNAFTKTPIGACEPWSIIVPAQSKTTA